LKFLQEQIDHNPNSSALYQVQGQLQLQSKQNELAEASFSHAVDLDHYNLAALVLLAQTQSDLGKTDQAYTNYQKAIELSPRDPHLFVALGTLYEKSGDWQRARESYQKALAIQPEDALASNNLAYLLLEHNGDVTLALSLAQTGRKGLPKLPNAADTLGWAYYQNRAYSAAVPLFESALKAMPNNQTYHYHLGLSYQKLQNPARAKAELEKAISIDPKSAVADLARHAISELAIS
jgi:Flp pilus assembly protein TadD